MLLVSALLQGVALVGGTVHDLEAADAGEAARVATVLIEDGRIVAVGSELDLPEGTRTVDVTGKHLVPGLIDGFAHHDPDHDVLYVASGVTLVRDAGNALMRILVERTPAARDRAPGPALWVAGAVLDGVPPATTEAVVLASVPEVEDKLPRLFETGIDYVSAHDGLEADVWKRAIELTHEAGLRFWGPRPRAVLLPDLCAAGPDGLFHLDGLLTREQAWDTVTAPDLAPAIDAIAEAGVAVTPTLAVFAQRLVPPRPDAPELARLGPLYVRSWVADADRRRQLIEEDAESFMKRGLAAVKVQGELLKALHECGVSLVPGSASPHPWLLPGRALLNELSLWRRAGLESREVLRLATSGAARALGCEEERGSIAPGRVADVLVLDRDPTEDLSALASPAYVVLRGRVLPRAELERLVADLERTQAERREEAQQPIEVHEPELPEGQLLIAGKVETRVAGQRLSAERFGVVREPDGGLAYCGRLLTRGGASSEDTELALVQRVRDGRLASFTLRVRQARSMLVVEGEREHGALKIARRLDGTLLDERKVVEPVLFLEAGSVTSLLILGREAEPGAFRALFFDGPDPATGEWTLALDPTNAHMCRTPGGDLIVRYDPLGFPEVAVRRQGAAFVESRTIESQAFGGPGLPLPEAKRPRAEPAAATEEPARRPLFGDKPGDRPLDKIGEPVEAGGLRGGRGDG